MIQRLTSAEASIPEPARSALRGVGQVFFQENALSGAFFLLGILVGSPLMALGGAVGAAIGTATARLARLDPGEIAAGIFGFNPALVGMAAFFFFRPGLASVGLLAVGCVAATLATRLLRRSVPFPTYTAPFVLTAWALFLLGPALGAEPWPPGEPVSGGGLLAATANGVGQVMFQANLATALLFVLGIALGDRKHAAWVVAASALGALVASYHVTPGQRAVDPEQLVERFLPENIQLGLYGYNATLAALALWIWRRSPIPVLLGVVLSVPLTELVPMSGLPALTAPFILATWLVLAFGLLEARWRAGLGVEPGPGGSLPPTEAVVPEPEASRPAALN